MLDSARNSGALARALELRALDREQDARREWRHFLANASAPQAVVAAHVAADASWHPLAIASVSSAGAWDLVPLRFPTPYRAAATHAADTAGINLAWLYGIVRQESAFQPDAASGAGAVGLAQLLPRTARAVARKAQLKWGGTKSLREPATNLELGARYLASLLQRFEGDIAASTAAYNAGPSRAVRWRERRHLHSADLWVETVPFSETRQHIRRVTFNSVVYRHTMGLARVRTTKLISAP